MLLVLISFRVREMVGFRELLRWIVAVATAAEPGFELESLVEAPSLCMVWDIRGRV